MKIILLLTISIFVLFTFDSCKKESSTESQNKAPDKPSNPSPADGATSQALNVTLSWSCDDLENDPLTYDIYFGTTNPPTTLVSQNRTATTLSRSNLYSGITYYWKVIAKDNHSNSTSSSVWIFTTTTDIAMVFVQGGTYLMGSPDSVGYSDERPRHSVTLSSFYISKYEVTQAQWKNVIEWKQQNGGTTLSATPSSYTGDLTRPVETVSWADIQLWLGYLNEKLGTTTYRLPTEAEWEYAARGGIHSGDNYIFSGSNNSNAVAWWSGNSNYTTHSVGTKQANQLGIYDMSGNVFEWCNDWYSSTYYSVSPQNNPPGPTSGSARVLRGGSFIFEGDIICRVAFRYGSTPGNRDNSPGFRLSRTN